LVYRNMIRSHDGEYKMKIKYNLLVVVLILSSALFIGCSDNDNDESVTSMCAVPQEASLDSQVRIGGATTNAQLFYLDGNEWTLFNIANELRATQVGMVKGPEYVFEVESFIHDIEIVNMLDVDNVSRQYALLAMGEEGIAAVDITDPINMSLVASVQVNYYHEGITWTEGGGDVVPDNIISGTRGAITSLAVYDDGDVATPLQLLIGNAKYGLQKTALSNLFDADLGRENDGTLLIDLEAYTLQYAGENPWGGPESLTLFDGKLFVAQGFLGLGIFDPESLAQVGRYNLYTDVTENNGGEDWFIDMNVAEQVQDSNLDVCTGMPNYLQASFEIQKVWHSEPGETGETAETAVIDPAPAVPWADFDRYGKFYYDARKVSVETFFSEDTIDGEITVTEKTIAYIAYGLGGLVAVDVTGYDSAVARNADCTVTEGFLEGKYLGYVPALPAHGPDEPTGEQSQSLFPYFGAGMLKEAGVIDVQVDTTNNSVYFSDHFAGLMVIGNADNPAVEWNAGTFNNDPIGVLGDHWPDYEFVTSYDMTPVIPDGSEESVPTFISKAPILLATGEVSGHGNNFALTATSFNSADSGQVDVVMTSGAGGLSFLDVAITGAQASNSFAIPVHIATTNEIGAAADGTATQEINIGHAEGVAAYGPLLFLADGPHGMSVWQIADDQCIATDDVHLVANTLQSEYPVEANGSMIYPAPHAHEVVLDPVNKSALVMSQSRGVRRINVAEEGTISAPLLLYPELTDIYEHSNDAGNVTDFLSIQDHAYSAALKGTLAFTADGSNGMTVYDLSKDPTDPSNSNSFVVSNLGGDTNSRPDLGRVSGIALWDDESEDGSITSYAFVAAGSRGIAVVDVSDVENMTLIKIFEPIKMEDDHVGKADGKSVAVKVVGDHAFFTYDSFGIVSYSIADLTAPLIPETDPQDIWPNGEVDQRPIAAARFKLQDATMFGWIELAGWSGGSVGMDVVTVDGKNLFYVAYGDAGVIKIDWTDPANPVLMQHINTVGFASGVAVVNGRAYVADGAGGLTLLK
jgi:hypothetical protein